MNIEALFMKGDCFENSKLDQGIDSEKGKVGRKKGKKDLLVSDYVRNRDFKEEHKQIIFVIWR
ncbi:UNVERIFIED_CONTAM: hypothetical protein NCL1_22974 [Trichonephila clavipes]